MEETKQKECGMCCKLVPPKCVNKDCVCHTETKQKEIREKFETWAINEMISNKLPTWSDCADWWLNEFSTLLSEDRAKTVEIIKEWTPKKDSKSYGVNKVSMTLDDHKRNFSRDIINKLNNRE